MRFVIAGLCSLWVMLFAAWNHSVAMLMVGVGMLVLNGVTMVVVDVRRNRDGEWKE